MPEFSAALFATQERPFGEEHSLRAHALLMEGSRPYWEIFIGGKIFRFIPHPDFILEDGLWQINSYCHIPESEYKHDVSENDPLTLEEEFGEDVCATARKELTEELAKSDIHFKLVYFPGFWMNKWNDKIKAFSDAGAKVVGV